MAALKPAQQQQRQRLQHSRLWATLLLLLACGLFIISCLLLNHHPAMGYLKAFSEAAMVGALADWFAITALFRQPLGLPIPHTAILVRKQSRIASELGRFIENNFLHSKTIASHLYQWHPAQQILNWLSNANHRQQWLPLLSQQIPRLMRTISPAAMARFSTSLLDEHYSGRQLGATLAGILHSLQQHQLDQTLLRRLLKQLRHWLRQPQTRQLLENSLLNWAGSIRTEDPSGWEKLKSSLKISLTARFDHWIAAKTLDWADSYLTEALQNRQHPLWRSYRRQLLQAQRQLQRNPSWHQYLASLRHQLASSATVQQHMASLWDSLTRWSEQDIHRPDSWWLSQLNHLADHLLSTAGQQSRFTRRLDSQLVVWSKNLIDNYKHHAGQFIANKVNSWDSAEMIDKIELSIGNDLQFIRINGTLVGGLIGLIIHALSQLLLLPLPA